MFYNKTLQSNNTDLQAILNTINALPEVGGEQATPEISVATSGLITATAGSKSSTYQLAFQAAKTITPSTVSQVAVSSGYYTGGNITVAGDSNLVAGNIKSGVSIFGVNGSLEEADTQAEDAIVSGTIANYTNDRVTNVGDDAFYFCSSLRTASFSACTNIGRNAFHFCSNLTTVSFPVCEYIDEWAFAQCKKLTTIFLPTCSSINDAAFMDCSNLATASLPVCEYINNGVFSGCWKLSSILLGASTVCTLSNVSAFTETPFRGYTTYFSGTPHIYVPASLIDAYRTATNWTIIRECFRTIENKGRLFTFTIGTTSQTSEEMTWKEWVKSEYNTNGYSYNDSANYIQIKNNKVMYNGTAVKGTDFIIAQGVYTLEALEDNAPE